MGKKSSAAPHEQTARSSRRPEPRPSAALVHCARPPRQAAAPNLVPASPRPRLSATPGHRARQPRPSAAPVRPDRECVSRFHKIALIDEEKMTYRAPRHCAHPLHFPHPLTAPASHGRLTFLAMPLSLNKKTEAETTHPSQWTPDKMAKSVLHLYIPPPATTAKTVSWSFL